VFEGSFYLGGLFGELGMSIRGRLETIWAFSPKREGELAEKWKHLFWWDHSSETIFYFPGWSEHDFHKVGNEWEHKERVAYQKFLENKANDAYQKRWYAFRLRPEVGTAGDLSPEEVVQLEKKWSREGLIWYDAKLNIISISPIIEDWNERNPYFRFAKEIGLLHMILNARKVYISGERAKELVLWKTIDQLIEHWGPFLDTHIPTPGPNAAIIKEFQARRRLI